MKDVIVIDQAVPASIQDILERVALCDKINWLRQERATYPAGSPLIFPLTPDAVDVQQFTHTLYEDNQPVSKLFPSILPVMTAIPYTIKQMIRIKMNLCVYAQMDNPNAHELITLWRTNRIGDEVMHRLEAELDLEQTRLKKSVRRD